MENDKIIPLTIIVILIGIMSYRVFTQGQKIQESMRKMEEGETELLEMQRSQEKTQENREVELDDSFRTPDDRVSFDYPSDWTPLEEEGIMDLFHKAPEPEKLESIQQELPEEGADPEMESLREELEDAQKEMDEEMKEEIKKREMHFIAHKPLLPQFSIGVISLQEVVFKEEKNKEEILNFLKKDLEKASDHDEEVEIISSETDENTILMETEVLIEGRPVIRAENVAMIPESKEKFYLLALSGGYEDWEHFQSIFRRIVSSIEFDES